MKVLFLAIFTFASLLFNAQTAHLIIKENNKFGIKHDGKIIVFAKYDSIKIEKHIISAKINNHYDLYSLDGKIIAQKIRKYFSLKNDEQIQVLNFKNQIQYFDSQGVKYDVSDFYTNYGISYFENIEVKIDLKKNSIKSLYPSSGARNDTLRIVQYEQKIPKRIRLISFMNGHNSIFSVNLTFFETLNTNYVIVKIKGKYGVWKYDESKMMLQNIYDRILTYNTHLILEKEGLFTIYPNIGEVPKYKKISPYEYFFSRFETVDNQKGWVDRNGIEYYDH